MNDGPECNNCGDGNISKDHVCGPVHTWPAWRLNQLGIKTVTKLKVVK